MQIPKEEHSSVREQHISSLEMGVGLGWKMTVQWNHMSKGEWGRARGEGDGLSPCHETLYKPWNGSGTLLKV